MAGYFAKDRLASTSLKKALAERVLNARSAIAGLMAMAPTHRRVTIEAVWYSSRR